MSVDSVQPLQTTVLYVQYTAVEAETQAVAMYDMSERTPTRRACDVVLMVR